jgi:hypothetical protein
MRSDWRPVAKAREAELSKPRDEDTNRETVADLHRRLDEARPISDAQESMSEGGPDYFFFSRRVPAKKGKWRMVSSEAEQRESGASASLSRMEHPRLPSGLPAKQLAKGTRTSVESAQNPRRESDANLHLDRASRR